MNNIAHGMMFHHFHDECKHVVGQGSISSETFSDILDFYGKEHNIISAEEFCYKAERDNLSARDVCLTFDDGLLCQYDIAYPVLTDRGLTAFWFIYSSPLDGVIEKLEIYRHFRSSMFSDIEDFYAAFFDFIRRSESQYLSVLEAYDPDKEYLDYPFYTPNDKRFRYLRDDVLGVDKYNAIMDNMLVDHKYDVEGSAKKLWMSADNIVDLHRNGHIIGLHSYSHPTVMANMNYEEQLEEYSKNKEQFEDLIGERIVSASYPCSSYNEDTLKVMRELGVTVAFRASMAKLCLEERRLELPREDHANILREMKKSK